MWVRSQFVFPKFTNMAAYMAAFLYAGSTITEELRNVKSNKNIWG